MGSTNVSTYVTPLKIRKYSKRNGNEYDFNIKEDFHGTFISHVGCVKIYMISIDKSHVIFF